MTAGDLAEGERLGRYLVLEKLGAGQMAAAYRARHVGLEREVVLKTMLRDSALERSLFVREARALAALDHPGVVRVFDLDEDAAGRPYLAMDLVRGRPLAELLRAHGRLDPGVAVKFAIDVADALHHVHAHRLAHRDICPENVLVSATGGAVLVDFGIVTSFGDYAAAAPGRAIGTPPYMSPEAWAGEPTTAGMDLWALAVTLHELVTGRPPWASTAPGDLRAEIAASPPRFAEGLPDPLRALLVRCLSRQAGDRPADAAALRRELDGVLSYCEKEAATLDDMLGRGAILVDVEHAEPGVPGRYREYRVHGILGEGSFGQVLRATDVLAKREVALKVLHPRHAKDPATVRRFRREARILARTDHPNLVHVYNFGTLGGRPFMVLELLSGKPLSDAITPGGMPVAVAVRIACDMLAGLGALHAEGVVHRDVKPDNVLLVAERAVIADLGIAHVEDDETKLTAVGNLVGTPLYLSPEQAKGLEVTPATDIYATGAVLFEMLTGRPPFDGASLAELVVRITTTVAPDVRRSRPDVPPDVAATVTTMLACEPDDRPGVAADVAATLRAALGGPSSARASSS